MAGKETYNLGPAWILTAANVTDPIDEWYNLGYTQGNIVATPIPGRVVTHRVDQLGVIPLASAVWQHPNGFELTFPLVDRQIDTLLKVAPGSVKLTGDSKEVFALGSGVKGISGRAFAIVPVSDYVEDQPWWDSEKAIYVYVGIANISNQIQSWKEVEENDLNAYEVTVTHLDQQNGRGGIGAVWTPIGGVNVVGLNAAASMEFAVPVEATRTALSGAGFDTVRDLVDNVGAIDLSTSTLENFFGLEYAFRSSGIDVSDNNATEDHLSEFVGRLWKARASLGLASCAIDLSLNNGLNAEATAQINGTGVYAYGITGADTTNDAFTVSGDRRSEFHPGRKFAVSGSTGNDGTYTVAAKQVIYSGADHETTIYVDESVADATADGSINDGLSGAGCTVTT